MSMSTFILSHLGARLGGTIGGSHAAEASTASSPTNEMARNVFHLSREKFPSTAAFIDVVVARRRRGGEV